jgi:hypothetical protein
MPTPKLRKVYMSRTGRIMSEVQSMFSGLSDNGRHLEPVTHRENVLRGNSPSARHARKTACHRGHPINEANTWVNPKNGARQCRVCKRLRRGGALHA